MRQLFGVRRRTRILPAAVAAVLLTLVFSSTPLQAEAAPLPMSPRLPASHQASLGRYSVPSGALFVATTGSDSNPGTKAAPFRTVGRALSKVRAGGTVVVRGGVYREGASGVSTGGTRYHSRLNGVQIQSYPGERVWMDGTHVVKSWTRVSANHYTVKWDTPALCSGKYYTRHYSSQTGSGPCSYPDGIGQRSSLGDPQMLFRNGTALKQVGSVKELSADTFFYDWHARVMHIGFDPNGKTVEITKHAQAMALFQPKNVSIRGIGFRRYASNQMGNATQGAIVLNGGENVLLEKVSLINNAGGGLLSWATHKLTIRESVISGNGATGFSMNGSRDKNASARDDLLIEYSRLDRNNADFYGVDCTSACSSAGAKLVGIAGANVRFSTFIHNGGLRASGLWFDLDCYDVNIYGNKMIGNARNGLVYEVSDKAIIASNIIADNGWGVPTFGGGTGLMVGSANVAIWNNTINNNKMSVLLYDDDRSPGSSTGYDSTRVGPDSVNIDFVNNVVTTPTRHTAELVSVAGGRSTVPGNTSAAQAIRLMDHNSYGKPSAGRFVVWRNRSNESVSIYTSLQALRSKQGGARESQGHLINGNGETFLKNPHLGDYTLKSDSAARNSGRPLPADIASRLGVRAGVVVDRGVLTLGA